MYSQKALPSSSALVLSRADGSVIAHTRENSVFHDEALRVAALRRAAKQFSKALNQDCSSIHIVGGESVLSVYDIWNTSTILAFYSEPPSEDFALLDDLVGKFISEFQAAEIGII